MKPYGEAPDALLDLREAAEHPWMGLTALLNKRPYLVIGKDGNNFILEGEDGDIQKHLQFEWKDATENSRLVAASRQDGSALAKGSVLGGFTVGNVRYHEGEWYVLQATKTALYDWQAIYLALAGTAFAATYGKDAARHVVDKLRQGATPEVAVTDGIQYVGNPNRGGVYDQEAEEEAISLLHNLYRADTPGNDPAYSSIIPLASIVSRLEENRHDPRLLSAEIRQSIRYDGENYSCPECNSNDINFDSGDHPEFDAHCNDCGFPGTTDDFMSEPPDLGGDVTDSSDFDWYPDWEHESKVAGDIASVVASTVENNGGTFDPISLDPFQPTSGYFASKDGFQISTDEFSEETLSNVLQTLELKGGEYIGTWVHEGSVYIDPARWFENERDAMQFASENNQMTIYDVANGKEVPVSVGATAKTASTFEMPLPPQGIHLRTNAAIAKEGLSCTVHFPPIPAYPDGLSVEMPGGGSHAMLDAMDYSDEIEMAGGNLESVTITVIAPDGQEDAVRAVIDKLGGRGGNTVRPDGPDRGDSGLIGQGEY